jgi:hypothetical protein
MTLKSAFKLYKYKIITDFGKLRLIISAHTNYLLKLLKNFPSRTRDAQYTSNAFDSKKFLSFIGEIFLLPSSYLLV